MESLEPNGQLINLGSGRSYSIEELARMIARTMGKEDRLRIEIDRGRLRPCDVDLLQCDNTRICELGWRLLVDIEEGLKRTIDHYSETGQLWPWEKWYWRERWGDSQPNYTKQGHL